MSEDAATKFSALRVDWTPGFGRRSKLRGSDRRGGAFSTGARVRVSQGKVYRFRPGRAPHPMIVLAARRALPADELRRRQTLGPQSSSKFRGRRRGSARTITARHRTQLFALLGSRTAARARQCSARRRTQWRPDAEDRRAWRSARKAGGRPRRAAPCGRRARHGRGPRARRYARVIASFLFNTAPADGPTFAIVAVCLIAAGCAAAWLPARHAARVDPARALRAE